LTILDIRSGAPVVRESDDGEKLIAEDGTPLPWLVSARDIASSRDISFKFFANPIQVDAETLLVPMYNRYVFQMDLPSATVDPTFQGQTVDGSGRLIASPLIEDNVLMIGGQNAIVGLNPSSLSQIWEVPTGHAVWSAPAIHNGVAYFTSLDHMLYAVEIVSGTELWTLDLDGAATATPLIVNDHIYVGSFAAKVFEISLDGDVLSTAETDEWVWGTPLAIDNTLYLGDLGGNVYAFDIQDGLSLDWKTAVADGAIRPAPVQYGDFIIVASRDKSIYWLNRNSGSVVNTRELNNEILADILVVDADETLEIARDMIIISTMGRKEAVVAFSAAEGELLWTYGQ
jgi:outer membrane protein assembly factor BamB